MFVIYIYIYPDRYVIHIHTTLDYVKYGRSIDSIEFICRHHNKLSANVIEMLVAFDAVAVHMPACLPACLLRFEAFFCTTFKSIAHWAIFIPCRYFFSMAQLPYINNILRPTYSICVLRFFVFGYCYCFSLSFFLSLSHCVSAVCTIGPSQASVLYESASIVHMRAFLHFQQQQQHECIYLMLNDNNNNNNDHNDGMYWCTFIPIYLIQLLNNHVATD